MKAITYTTYGPPEVLRLDEVAKPVPKDDEVLIRVRAAEATKSDVEMRRFKFAVKWFWLPLRIAFGLRKPKRHILGGYFSGDTALINGAGGSIGTHAIQIAKSMGAEVTAVDSGIKERMLRRLGADHFIDYELESFTSMDAAYDVIFDMVASSPYAACIKTLRPGGRYLSCNPRLSVMLRSFLTNQFTDKTATFAFAGETKAALGELKAMIEAGTIKSIVDRIYPMERAADAHRRVEAEQRLGAVVIAIGDRGDVAMTE